MQDLSQNRIKKGTLYLVSTPIGNLEDITLRAIRMLKEADFIAAEDTRHTLKLLNHFGIKNQIVSFHEHSSAEKCQKLFSALEEGKSIALVSDAGTPLISDPGAKLVKGAVERGIEISAVPGPCAAISALCVSALPSGKFIFEGFLPKDKTRRDAIEKLKENVYTSVVYESPHQLKKTLEELAEVLGGNRKIAIAREITKHYEEVIRTDMQGAVNYFIEQEPRGEFVLVIEGKAPEAAETTDEQILDELQRQRKDKTNKKAVEATASVLKVNKNRVYQLSLTLK